MLCLKCATRSPSPRTRHTLGSPSAAGVSRLRNLVCCGCGSVLPLTDSTDGLLSKLVQLDGFGLGAFAAPLLQHGRPVPLGE
jgi:hypothetical protein